MATMLVMFQMMKGGLVNLIEFFMPMIPPETTHQQKKVRVVFDKKKNKHVPIFYEPESLAAARSKLTAHLSKHVPLEKVTGPVRMVTKWIFPLINGHQNGDWKYTKPDNGNMNKLLEDCMEELGFYKNDAQISSLIVEKFWGEVPGIYIKIEEL